MTIESISRGIDTCNGHHQELLWPQRSPTRWSTRHPQQQQHALEDELMGFSRPHRFAFICSPLFLLSWGRQSVPVSDTEETDYTFHHFHREATDEQACRTRSNPSPTDTLAHSLPTLRNLLWTRSTKPDNKDPPTLLPIGKRKKKRRDDQRLCLFKPFKPHREPKEDSLVQ